MNKETNNSAKPTRGTWKAIGTQEGGIYSQAITVNSVLLANVVELPKSFADSEANAQLIADAGNTYNETGKLPSELAKERNELFKMVKSLKNCIKRLTEGELADKDLEAYWIGEAHELLLNVNGGAYWKNANE